MPGSPPPPAGAAPATTRDAFSADAPAGEGVPGVTGAVDEGYGLTVSDCRTDVEGL